MLAAERRNQIIELIRSTGATKVSELARRFSVSPMTIRRDLECLEQEGLILRTHGGALAPTTLSQDLPLASKASSHLEEKASIAEWALRMIRDGEAIILDAGSTTLQLARRLRGFERLTVVTNDLKIAAELADTPGLRVICTGGYVQPQVYSLHGEPAENVLQSLHVDLAFLGADAVDPQYGVMTRNLDKVRIKQLIIRAAARSVLLADHSKFGRRVFVRICPLHQIHLIITDEGLDPKMAQAVREAGVELMVAKRGAACA